MSEMIERVALALEQFDLDGASGIYRKQIELAARAAIEAMREPTKEMANAGQDSENYPSSSAPLSCDVKEVWQLMIDEALK